MLHKTGIHLFLLRNMLRSWSKLKETSFTRIFHESPKLAGFDLYGECSRKVENKLMLFTRWKSCNGHLCYTVENSEMFTCKENFFGVAFNRCLEDQDQYLPKKRSRTNNITVIKKTCLFSGLSKRNFPWLKLIL